MDIFIIISNVLILIGLMFSAFSIIGLMRFKGDFYLKSLVAAKADTVGMITFLAGLAFRHGFSFFTAKLVFLMVVILILNPMMGSLMLRCYYKIKVTPIKETEIQSKGGSKA